MDPAKGTSTITPTNAIQTTMLGGDTGVGSWELEVPKAPEVGSWSPRRTDRELGVGSWGFGQPVRVFCELGVGPSSMPGSWELELAIRSNSHGSWELDWSPTPVSPPKVVYCTHPAEGAMGSGETEAEAVAATRPCRFMLFEERLNELSFGTALIVWFASLSLRRPPTVNFAD